MALAYLRVPADDRLYAADASLIAAGGAVAKVGAGVVRELWRRISLKVRHLGLLDPVTASLRPTKRRTSSALSEWLFSWSQA